LFFAISYLLRKRLTLRPKSDTLSIVSASDGDVLASPGQKSKEGVVSYQDMLQYKEMK
jgi:hypothetical protein